MSVIQIREKEQIEDGFTVTLSIDGQDYGGAIAILAPFAAEPQKEANLGWYFEEWLRMPLVDAVRAQSAAESVREYGVSLFEQVFRDRKAYNAYDRLLSNLMNLQIEIIGASPEFQAWHWESLCDPELPRPFAVDCALVRKYTRPTAMPAQVKPSPVVNVLLVVARPDEEDDVGYRTISRTLVELVDSAQLRVNVEILRPATYKALVERLTERGAGYYHILHFDGHGALLTYADYKMGLKRNRYLYQRGYGLGDLGEYAGSKAFLFFDGDKKGQAVPVEAADLAGLLTGKQIPVCILNACQSAKQLDYANETSLGSQLMAAGMQAVVAMGYSVTTVAAKLLMRRLYEELFANRDFYRAVRMGRQELFHDRQRRGYFNTAITLEDWLLPVVYASNAVDLNLCEFTPAEEEQYYERLGSLYRFEPPNYGFVGRDLEILKIEKALLKWNALLLRGMGGTGKTTLLKYLHQWWVATDFAKDAFYFGYDEKAWTLEQIIFAIGKQVYDRFEQAKFAAMNLVAQLQKLVQKLKSENYVLMLDNLESVTGQQLAIMNTLNESQQNDLRNFLRQLVGGKTKVVLGSRSGEEWLKDVFKSNIYGLQGLDLEARTLLADRILEQHVAPELIEPVRADEDFKRLMKVLAGYPLAMEVVLANLKRQTPKQILAALQAADIDLDKGSDKDGGDKTSSILKCVEYSHSNLSESAQKLLLCLAPFSGFIWRDALPNYAAELQKLEAFQDYDFANFEGALQEAINWGLLSPMMAEDERFLTIQPVFPYFLQVRLNEVEATTREAMREGFKIHYRNLASFSSNLMRSKDSQERQLGIFICRLEYENLYTALRISLDKQESISIYFCLDKYFEVINNSEGWLKIAEQVNQTMEKYPSKLIEGELGEEVMLVLESLSNTYLRTNQYEQSKLISEKELKVLESIQTLGEKRRSQYKATIYHQLGIAAHGLRQWDEAKQYYLNALEIGDRYSQANTYHQLGGVALELQQWDEAKQYYLNALEIKVEFSDRYSQANTYHQLGRVAQELRQWEEAKQNYLNALDIYVEFSDRYLQAGTYNNLGMVAHGLRQWEEAKQNYLKALEIKVEFSDRYSQASTYHNLGIVALDTGEIEEAKQNYLIALEIYLEFRDKYSIETFSIPRLAQIYQSTQSDDLLAATSKILGVSIDDVRQLFAQSDTTQNIDP
ncbi:tetratricopeptide repeat protein [Tumidithrix elongata RA019]|uniref:Tetratricopeptide repeat protein n=1 Tax=Tumidithrix elongata BACA0141 TaxID=2716417 RepID=A0AAW9PWM5_9CYAN|nr:tetratricopeptide repeat protein [Tumidithrix elongata RA019]